MTYIEFREWPKTPRLNRDMIVTEKIDGTNAAVIVLRPFDVEGGHSLGAGEVTPDGAGIVVNVALGEDDWEPYIVAAQSRKRVISPGKQTDNAGFAAWVRDNAQALADALGEGYHYGEWWGKGIQHGYGQEGKRFSLFNVNRYADADLSALPQVDLVPVLFDGRFNMDVIAKLVDDLRQDGSAAAPGQKAEGVIVFHVAAGHVYKVLCENDELPKGVVPRQEREARA